MQSTLSAFVTRFADYRISCQLPVQDRFVDSGKVLVDDSAGAEVEMPNFRIAHLAFGKPDIHPARAQAAHWIRRVEMVVIRCLCEKCRVPVRFRGLPAMRINPPSVPNNQHHWLRHTGLRLSGNWEIGTAVSRAGQMIPRWRPFEIGK